VEFYFIYWLIPNLVPLNQTKFLFKDTGKSFLWIVPAQQYYWMTEKEWMDSCNIVSMSYVCKQNYPLLSSHLHENCMVKLLEPRGSVLPSCDKRVVEISNSVWTQLTNNKWINFAFSSESITVRCVGKPLVDIIVSAIGKLQALVSQHYLILIPS
jgi:hypothetical protein